MLSRGGLYAVRDCLACLVAPVDDTGAVVGCLEAESQIALVITVERHLLCAGERVHRASERKC